MLLQFSIKNYTCFKEKVIFSLLASNYDKNVLEETNVILLEKFGLRILKSGIIYGANASGKTKIYEALRFFKYFVVSQGLKSSKGDSIDVKPFRLDNISETLPTEFEIIFFFADKIYRYGFEATKTQIVSEWLFCKLNKKEISIFQRSKNSFETHSEHFKKGEVIKKEDLLRDNILLLSLAAGQLNEQGIVNEVYIWIKNYLKFIDVLSNRPEEQHTKIQVIENSEKKSEIINFLNAVDIHVTGITVETDLEKILRDARIPDEIKEEIRKQHDQSPSKVMLGETRVDYNKYDENNNVIGSVDFSMEKDESSGTRAFFSLAGPILDTIENGYTLIIDELGATLHTNLVEKIMTLFHSNILNTKNAQLIANTHNTHLLSKEIFRRDQIWFVEKNEYGMSSLYSLADFSVKSDENFEKSYIRGKYDAVPHIANFEYTLKI